MTVYVEIAIPGRLNDLWERTQVPEWHECWDLRFTSIEYVPRADDSEPQRFLYTTRIGFGLEVRGQGETVGTSDGASGQRASSLRFWSDDPKSLIREGAGYWQYVPVEGGIRFITAYDYRTRFGGIGRVVDRLVFRPLIGWATAWSFDRLRLWIEKGLDPAVSMQRSLIHGLSRVTVAMIWLYQGLVPKLIARHADELALLAEAGIPSRVAPAALIVLGGLEIVMGIVVLLFWRSRWPLRVTSLLMLAATMDVAVNSPRYLSAAFNPVSLNLCVAMVALIGFLSMRDLPSARNCLRRKPEKH